MSQPPADTLGVEALTDSTFLIWLGERNQKNDKLNIKYIDDVFDSLGVAQFAFEQIQKNEARQWEADRVKLQASAVTKLYLPVNQILTDFSGGNYLKTAFDIFKAELKGVYRANYDGQVILFRLKPIGEAVQINAQGGEIVGGYSGTWDILELNRLRIKNFFPVAIVPANAVFNRAADGGKQFKSLSTTLTITKIR